MNTTINIKTNISEVCTQALVINEIIGQIKQESCHSTDFFNQYCQHCIHFNPQYSFPCFLHPYLALTNWWGANNCRDFELSISTQKKDELQKRN